MFLPSFACCVFACFFSWTVADISSMKYETDLATHGMPLAECKWDVKDEEIIALSLTDNNASIIVTIKHDSSQCMVDVGSKAFVRCDKDDKFLSVSVLFPDFEFGETRTYSCKAVLFNDVSVWTTTYRTNATRTLQCKGDVPRDDDECSSLGYILMAVALTVLLGLLPLNIYSLFKCFKAKFRPPHEDSKMDSTRETDRHNNSVKLDQTGTVDSKSTDPELGEPHEELNDTDSASPPAGPQATKANDEKEQDVEELCSVCKDEEGGSKAPKDKKEQDVEELRKLLGKDEEGGSEAPKDGSDSGFCSRCATPIKKVKGWRRKDTPYAPTNAELPHDCTSPSQAPDSAFPPAGPQASKANVGYTVVKTDEPVDCTGQAQAKQRPTTTKPRRTTGPSKGTAGRGRGGYSDPA